MCLFRPMAVAEVVAVVAAAAAAAVAEAVAEATFLFELVRKDLALDAEVRVLGGSGGDGRVREGEGEWPRRAAPEREEERRLAAVPPI